MRSAGFARRRELWSDLAMLGVAGSVSALSGGAAGTSPGLFHVDWLDAAKLRVPAGSPLLRIHAQTGNLICTILFGICGRLLCLDAMPAQVSRVSPLPFPFPFFRGGSALRCLGAGLLDGRAALCGRLTGCAARGGLAVLGRSMSSECISMRP